MTLDYVDLETAKRAAGARLVTSSLVPSPWSEAAKGCLHLARVPTLVVGRGLDKDAIDAWTGIDNVPALLVDREPVRTHWAAIVGYAHRAGRSAGLLPDEPAARAQVMGTLDVIAGEEGIGWNARLAMIDAGLTTNGASGFPLPVSKFLARRYGHVADRLAAVRAQITEQLAFVVGQLRGPYFGGDAPNAIDVYSATFLTPVVAPISAEDCPGLVPPLRTAFASAHAAFGELVPAALREHRTRMFAEHLAHPIRLS